MLLVRVLVVSNFSWVTYELVRGCPIIPCFEHVRAGGGGGGGVV